MAGNFLVRYFAPDGSIYMKNIKGSGAEEITDKFLQEGFGIDFVIKNFAFDMLMPISNGGIKNKDISMLFLKLHRLVQSTGSVVKSFEYINGNRQKKIDNIDKIDKTNKTGAISSITGLKSLLYEIKRLYYKFEATKFKNEKIFISESCNMLKKGYSIREIFAIFYFDDIAISLADLASANGDYSAVFLKLSEYYSSKSELKKNIVSSVTYPVFLFLLLFIAFNVFLYYVIPSFTSFFAQFPKVSTSTAQVLSFFAYLRYSFVYYFIFGGLGLVSLFFMFRDKILFLISNIPIVKNFYFNNYLHWFFYQLSLMISSGITITKAFAYFKESSSNSYFKNKFNLMHDRLMSGFSLGDTIGYADFTDFDVVESIKYAEISGFLSDEIMRLSKDFKERAAMSMSIMTKGLFFVAFVSVVVFLLLMFFVIFLPLIQGMVSLSGTY